MHTASLPLRLDIRNLTTFAKKHIDDCTRFHPTCSSNIPKFQPTRIIDVGLEATVQNVCLTTLKGDRAQYVTLSHCCKFSDFRGGIVCSETPWIPPPRSRGNPKVALLTSRILRHTVKMKVFRDSLVDPSAPQELLEASL
jgi:hypothetical protein